MMTKVWLEHSRFHQSTYNDHDCPSRHFVVTVFCRGTAAIKSKKENCLLSWLLCLVDGHAGMGLNGGLLTLIMSHNRIVWTYCIELQPSVARLILLTLSRPWTRKQGHNGRESHMFLLCGIMERQDTITKVAPFLTTAGLQWNNTFIFRIHRILLCWFHLQGRVSLAVAYEINTLAA